MFTVTKSAAEQIRRSAQESNLEGLSLRVAAKRLPDGSLEYGMGFDEAHEDDAELSSEGVRIVVDPGHLELLRGTTLDYVEIEPGELRFIFINPNDANYRPATEP